MGTIERRALRSEAIVLCLEAACKLSLLNQKITSFTGKCSLLDPPSSLAGEDEGGGSMLFAVKCLLGSGSVALGRILATKIHHVSFGMTTLMLWISRHSLSRGGGKTGALIVRNGLDRRARAATRKVFVERKSDGRHQFDAVSPRDRQGHRSNVPARGSDSLRPLEYQSH